MVRKTQTAERKYAHAILTISYFMILLDNSAIFTDLLSIESGK